MDCKIVIIGAGDHGRSVLEILRQASRVGPRLEVIGFLDDAAQKKGATIGGLPVLGGLEWALTSHQSDYGYVMAVANTKAKERIAREIGSRSARFVSAIHPSVILAGGVRIEPGAILNAGVVVAYDTLIDAHSTVNLNATIGHDCVVGRFATIAPGANIAGRVRVGEGCDVGMNASIAAGLTLGEWSSVGIGSVVIRNVPARDHVFGNPARRIAAHVHV
jgi:sugar O-acyltransferase (sialic acid O-acetyltransferase NeuD family)